MRALGLSLLLLFAFVARTSASTTVIDVMLADGPHPPRGAPDAVVVVNSRVDLTKPLDVVVFLHGFSCCARALVATGRAPCRTGEAAREGYALADLHDQSGSDAVLIVPQLAYLARDAEAPRFRRAGGFDALVEQSLSALIQGHGAVRSVTLVAHSAGYRATATILKDRARKLPIDHLVFFDALYAHADVFARHVLEHPMRRVLSLYTPQTEAQSHQLAERLRTRQPLRKLVGPLDEAMTEHQVVVTKVAVAHGKVPGAYWVDVMRGLARATSERSVFRLPSYETR